MVGLTSAAGLLALLDENDVQLQAHALKGLNEVVDEFWAEIAGSASKLEVLAEDPAFPHRELASLVAAKIYFHLGSLDTALMCALGAGKELDVMAKTEFVETVVSYGIDTYIKQQVARSEGALVQIDPRLQAVVNRMFERCFADGQFKQALGIALEARRLDMVREAIVTSGDLVGMLAYTMDVGMSLVSNRHFRNKVLNIIVELYRSLQDPDHEAICRCLVYLNDADGVIEVIDRLIRDNDAERTQIAYQLCFDLYENATQQFLKRVMDGLSQSQCASSAAESFKKVSAILSGEMTTALSLEFLFRKRQIDLAILKNTKAAVEQRSSVLHSAIVFANAIMHAGTTSDQFLRDNLDWLARATNWSKFAAVGSLGVIHRGHTTHARTLLDPYLPRGGSGATGSPYSEGGALFALGLIHANHGAPIVSLLREALRDQKEPVQHGASLGLGLAAMGTGDRAALDALREVLYCDSAVAGEAAGLAMGLVMAGTMAGGGFAAEGPQAEALRDMLLYAHETSHDKIIRGIALGVALAVYGAEQEADGTIEQLVNDKDPLVRAGGMYAVGMAYAGTAANSAVRRLLHVAVSDVNDDVRRAAVTSLGFVLFGQPHQCPPMVALLAESFNPHVRYGATLALGIACAGTGLPAAIDILEPLAGDSVDFVRQGALVALGMVLIQHNEAMSPRVAKVRKQYEKIISDKHEDVMAKFGAIIGQGILDAGGRNVTISLLTRSGNPRAPSVIGLLCFTQYWYWYPLLNMISLAFTPTATILLNKDLKMPVADIISRIRPSAFAYPPMTAPPTSEKVEKVATAVLSTTAKAKARAIKAKESKDGKRPSVGGDAMDVDESSSSTVAQQPAAEKEAESASAAASPAKKEKEKKEPNAEVLQNPARVLPAQQKYIALPNNSRYRPVKKADLAGIVVVRDTMPDKEEALILPSTAGNAAAAAASAAAAPEENEPQPPEPFEFFDD